MSNKLALKKAASFYFACLVILAQDTQSAPAEVTVPEQFEFMTLTNELGGTANPIASVPWSNADSSVIVSTMSGGTMQLYRASTCGLQLHFEIDGFATTGYRQVYDLKYDPYGTFGDSLVALVWEDSDNQHSQTTAVAIAPNSTYQLLFEDFGGANELAFRAAISDSSNGYYSGLYLLDGDIADGEPLYHFAPGEPAPQLLLPVGRPPSVSNLSQYTFTRDYSGTYMGQLLLTESEQNRVHALSSTLTWSTISPPPPPA